jgi:hypothetical protein
LIGLNGSQPEVSPAGMKEEVVVMAGVETDRMLSSTVSLRKKVLEREKLLERCAFINGLSKKLGI